MGAILKLKKVGRKSVDCSPYRKKQLSSDAEVIWCLLKKQPQGRDELCKAAHIPKSIFYSVLPILENLGILKQTDKGYALWFYNEAEAAVIQTVTQWRKIAFRDPLPSEIADETGMAPEQSAEVARKTKDKTGWFMPNDAIFDNATEKLGEVLCYLARERDHVLKDFDYEKYPDDPEIVKEAKLGLKEHVEILPNLDEEGDFVSWPPNALKYLRKNYKPKDRVIPYVGVASPPRY